MSDGYEFEDVGCSVLRIGPLTSRTWTIEIQAHDSDQWVSVIMTADDLARLSSAAAILVARAEGRPVETSPHGTFVRKDKQ